MIGLFQCNWLVAVQLICLSGKGLSTDIASYQFFFSLFCLPVFISYPIHLFTYSPIHLFTYSPIHVFTQSCIINKWCLFYERLINSPSTCTKLLIIFVLNTYNANEIYYYLHKVWYRGKHEDQHSF